MRHMPVDKIARKRFTVDEYRKQSLTVRIDPKDGEYRAVRVLRRGESISVQLLTTVVFTIDELLG